MTTLSPQRRPARAAWLILAALMLAVVLVVAGPAQPVAASCGGTTIVGTEAQLNAAIAAFNAVAAGPCTFTIQLGADILVTSGKELANQVSGVNLVIEGAGHAVDAQGTGNRRVFFVRINTYVTMNQITVRGGNLNNADGAGFFLDGDVTGTAGAHLTLTNSTVTGNTLTGTANVSGAGISVQPNATLTVRNSTISGNISAQFNGGISSRGQVTLDGVTITGNSAASGGSGYGGFVGELTIRNTILAGNTGAPDCNNAFGTVTDQGHNLVQSQNNCGLVNGANGNIVGVSPNLGPLANNGGATQTHLPNAGSPVINAGDTTLTVDQRGVARPQGVADDIGAVEVVACPASPWNVATEAELNQAIGCFNAVTTAGSYTINVTQNISLTRSIAIINNSTTGVDLVIVGGNHTIDGDETHRGFEIPSPTDVTISDLTMTRCATLLKGGAIHSPGGGSLTLTNVNLTHNIAGWGGGGLASLGPVTITNSAITHNRNTATNGGGGIRMDAPGSLTLIDSEVSANTTAVSGGGIYVHSGAGLTVRNSTLSGNRGVVGSAIYSAGTLSVTNSTVSANEEMSPNQLAGAIVIASGSGALDSVTVYNNTGDPLGTSGVAYAAGASGSVRNSILAGNNSPSADLRCTASTVVALTRNLLGTVSGWSAGSSCDISQGGNITGQAPNLGPLANNGGPTQTHLPNAGSPALNAGDTTLTIDQRGEPRPVGPADDIGAVESQAGSLTIVKKTVGGDGTFSYSSTQLGDFRLTTQKKTAQRTFAGLAPGTYNVSEAPTQGWDLTNAICSNGSNPASITVGRGENVTCNFTNVKRGSITVVKTSAGGDGTFSFTSTTLGGVNAATAGGFSLTTVGGTTQRTFADLVAGTYDLAESTPAGWQLTGATCSDGSTLPTINLAAGEDVTCTFANAKQGSLTVVKQATGADTTFPFASTALGAFDLTTVNGTAQRTFANLNPGAYDLAETLPAGWQQTSATCSDGSTLPTVDVGAGEDVTCTFANSQLDTIVAIKLAVGGDDAFPFTSTALGAFTLTTTSGYAVQAFTGLTPGSYALAETPVTGWTMAEADPTCSNGDKASAISLGTGETIVCLFVNYKPDTIIVEKRTVGGDGAFGFTSNLPGAGSFSLTTANGTATRSFTGLAPATYNIAETPQAGWAQTGARCDDGSTPDSVTLLGGATVRCIFTDTKLSSVTVIKTTTGGDGSFAFTGSLGSFSLSTVSGTAQRLFANVLGGS
ncbi:MAG: right-handed parallel beta-helix repeat-containing protein, partial [Caldilineaceae bacterium]|nr:right-handed parallel beta-helix repeat-containing protein [Caldilineaceae bacterium]